MRKTRRLWPRLVVLCVSCALVPAMAALAQERRLVFDQIVGQPRALPQLSPDGDWCEIINATSRWVVIQTQSGQQFPVAVDDLGEFIARWPSGVDQLENHSVVEGFGLDLGSNTVETPHLDVFEGGDQAMVAPTYYNSLLPTSSMIINAWDFLGQASMFGMSYPTSPSMLGASVSLHVVGHVVNRAPVQVSIPGNNIATIVPPAGRGFTVTRVTRGSVAFLRKGDYAFFVPKDITPKGLVLSQFILYKTIPLPLFNPLR
jgi:hypothetical protein